MARGATTINENGPISGRDAVRSQVSEVLEAQTKRRPAMKKVSTEAAKQSRKISEQKLNRRTQPDPGRQITECCRSLSLTAW